MEAPFHMQFVEHRFSPRSAIALKAEIHHQRRYLGSFKTRDLGYRGLFVKTGRIGLLCGSLVQVTLIAPAGQRTLDAMVVHYSASGAGLLFLAGQLESLAFIRGLLSAAAA
jgi:hypothetical protein